MKKLLLVLALAVVPASAFAAGLDVSWNDCVNGALGTASSNKDFECAITANRNYNLEFQFKTPINLTSFVGINAYADLGPYGAPLSPFWHFEGTGCNGAGAIKGIAAFMTQPLGCGDGGYFEPWDGGSNFAGGLSAYGADFQTPGRGRIVVQIGRAGGIPIIAGDNWWAFRLSFRTANRAACAGCAEQHIVVWNEAILESDDGTPALSLSGSDKLSDCATINSAPGALCNTVPTKNTTWGQIKSMFR